MRVVRAKSISIEKARGTIREEPNPSPHDSREGKEYNKSINIERARGTIREKPNPNPHESHEGEEHKYRESERDHQRET